MTSKDSDFGVSPTFDTPADNGMTKEPLPPMVSSDQQLSPVMEYVKRSFESWSVPKIGVPTR